MRRAEFLLRIAAVIAAPIVSVFAASLLERYPAENRRRLLAGETVFEHVKTTTPDGKVSGYAQAIVLVNSPINTAFKIFCEFDKQYQYFPRKTVSKVLESTPTSALIYNEFDFYVATIRYTVRYDINRAGYRINFKLDPRYPHDIRDSAGFFLFEKVDEKRCLFTYAATKVDTGLKAPAFIQDYLTSRDLPAMALNVKKRIESGGKWTKSE